MNSTEHEKSYALFADKISWKGTCLLVFIVLSSGLIYENSTREEPTKFVPTEEQATQPNQPDETTKILE